MPIKQPKNNNRKYFIGLVIALSLLLLLNLIGWLPLTDAGAAVVRPFSTLLSRAGQRLGNAVREIGSVGSLNQKNSELEAKNQQLSAEIVRLRELEDENAQLRQQLKFPLRGSAEMVGADVIGYQPDNVRQLIQINRGTNDGIKVGQVVVSESNLVGKVQSVSVHAANVLLASDANFRVLVLDQNTRAPGIAAGQLGGTVIMDRIPQTAKVNNGDTIITNGLDGDFPPGLIVGEVVSTKRPGESIFSQAQLKQPFEVTQLKLVRVIVR